MCALITIAMQLTCVYNEIYCSDNESLVRLMNVPSLVSVCFLIKTGQVRTLPYLGSVRIRDDAPRTKKALANSPGPSHPFYGV
jgi:hypothetical protein